MTEADLADRHDLYQHAVQDPQAEMDFIEDTYASLRGRPLELIREDFCGTACSSCEFVSRSDRHWAYAVDLDAEVLAWGRKHNVCALPREARERIELVHADVRSPGVSDVDAVVAMNFSYYLFDQRATMCDYFRSVHRDLAPHGLLFLDAYGGYDAHRNIVERRDCDGFTYIWEQADFNPINQMMNCYIHFEFKDGSRQDRAFVYPWRLWTLTEIRELLAEAGFARSRVYWEGTDPQTGEGDGVFSETEQGTADAGWICYIVAEPR